MTAMRRSFTLPRRAVFLARDGTIVRDRDHVGAPEQVELMAGASTAIRYLNNALVPVVVVTNQPGIARGALSETDYERVHARLEDMLSEHNAFLDATYHCPHDPGVSGPCACRKPGVALYEQAIRELNLNPAQCTYIGDRWHDIAAAKTLGGRGILVPAAATPAGETAMATAELEVAPTIVAAVGAIIGTPHAGASD